jgi:hypothetical protein
MGRRPKDYNAYTQEDGVVQGSESGVVVYAISDEEWERRTKLCVSNPDYINPSYDR